MSDQVDAARYAAAAAKAKTDALMHSTGIVYPTVRTAKEQEELKKRFMATTNYTANSNHLQLNSTKGQQIVISGGGQAITWEPTFTAEQLERAYDEGHNEGYAEGYDEGYDDGWFGIERE